MSPADEGPDVGDVRGTARTVVGIGLGKPTGQSLVLHVARHLLLVVLLQLTSFSGALADKSADRPAGLTPDEKRALVAAIGREETVTVRAIVVAAVARDSSRLSGIVRDLFDLAPEQADAITARLGKVFPNLADRLADIAADIRNATAKRGTQDERISPEATLPASERIPEAVRNPWSGETVLGGSYRSAAQSSATASARFKLVHEAAAWRNSAEVEFDYGETNSVTNDKRLFVSGRSRRRLGERLYGFGMASYEDDRFSGFDYEVTEGVGLGYRLFDLADFDFDIEGGPSLRQNRITGTDTVNQEVLIRVATDLTWHISDSATLTNKTALYFSRNSVEVTSDAYGELRDGAESTNTSALDLKVIGNLAARFSYEIHYRSDPPPDGVTTETTGKVSLVHSF